MERAGVYHPRRARGASPAPHLRGVVRPQSRGRAHSRGHRHVSAHNADQSVAAGHH